MIKEQMREHLQKLQTAIAAGDAAGIKENIAAVEACAAEHGKDFDAQLRHFLRNRSYVKALDYLGGKTDIPAGRCGGGKSKS